MSRTCTSPLLLPTPNRHASHHPAGPLPALFLLFLLTLSRPKHTHKEVHPLDCKYTLSQTCSLTHECMQVILMDHVDWLDEKTMHEVAATLAQQVLPGGIVIWRSASLAPPYSKVGQAGQGPSHTFAESHWFGTEGFNDSRVECTLSTWHFVIVCVSVAGACTSLQTYLCCSCCCAVCAGHC